MSGLSGYLVMLIIYIVRIKVGVPKRNISSVGRVDLNNVDLDLVDTSSFYSNVSDPDA